MFGKNLLHGCPLYILQNTPKNLKVKLRDWKNHIFGNLLSCEEVKQANIVRINVSSAVSQFFKNDWLFFINMLRKSSFCCKLSLKINIWKAFETLDIENIDLKVLSCFSFDLLAFSSERLRKGDHLSHLPFYISKEVLNRGTGKLMEDGEVFFLLEVVVVP